VDEKAFRLAGCCWLLAWRVKKENIIIIIIVHRNIGEQEQT